MTFKDSYYFDATALEVYEDNVKVGWWDDPDRCLFTTMQLISTEVAEATEGVRKTLHDTHLPDRPMEEVEYADALIRTLDLGGKLQLSYDNNARAHRWCKEEHTVGFQQLGINASIIKFAEAYMDYLHDDGSIYHALLEQCYSDVVASIVQVAKNRELLVFEAMDEKREYNKTRADHKRENRAKINGKQF